jgi:hypothetical protein
VPLRVADFASAAGGCSPTGARTAAVRIGVACNKLAAKALAGGATTAAELAAAADAAGRWVARVEAAAALVHRRLA